eukprot:TRINITY_DN14970_c0_g1_i2.p1 TRINITY_DN14970_c0_g1~~TRINITY_DN14970_c0_g1_i2.p1  ORF type:complete len:100 (+),score=1.76 TRINITY_DN14970_c0_g1_i2:65-364(+)
MCIRDRNNGVNSGFIYEHFKSQHKDKMSTDTWKHSSIATPSNNSSLDDSKLKATQVGRHNEFAMEGNSNFKVMIRIRPPLDREINPLVPFQSAVLVVLI